MSLCFKNVGPSAFIAAVKHFFRTQPESLLRKMSKLSNDEAFHDLNAFMLEKKLPLKQLCKDIYNKMCQLNICFMKFDEIALFMSRCSAK